MIRKHQIRELALQILFLWDSHQAQDLDSAAQIARDHSEDDAIRGPAIESASAAWQQRESSDRWIDRVAPQWPAHRQPAVDRNILRLAIWELTSASAPPRVIIDEAIELAKHFSTEQSASFVNGVLDAILKEHTALTGNSNAEIPTS